MKYLGNFSSHNLPQEDWSQYYTRDGLHVQYQSQSKKVAVCIHHDKIREEFALFQMSSDFIMDIEHIVNFSCSIFNFMSELFLPSRSTNSNRLQCLIDMYSEGQIVRTFPIDDFAVALSEYNVRLYHSINRNAYEISIGNKIPIAVSSEQVASAIYCLIVAEIKKAIGDIHNPLL